MPLNSNCKSFDRDTKNLEVWTVAEAGECQPAASGQKGRTSLFHLEASDRTGGSEAGAAGSNMFSINFTCQDANPEKCKKAKTGFEQAGAVISSALLLRKPLIVNANFRPLGVDRKTTLGSAATTRYHLLTDKDLVNRLYPQSLVKQILPSATNLADSDIYAEFNADIDFWFQGDGPIKAGQHDFAYVILHELLHGLGFASSWRDYFELGLLTPLPSKRNSVSTRGEGAAQEFHEFAFDRFLIETKGSVSLANAARTIRTANVTRGGGPEDAVAGNLTLHGSALAESRRLFGLVQMPNSLAFALPGNEEIIVLETALLPYKPGSSVSHVAEATSKNTTDFLMRFSLESGVTLLEMVSRHAPDNPFGPIGPKLRKIMGAVGYSVRPTPGSTIHEILSVQRSASRRIEAPPLLGMLVASCFVLLRTL